ncbi:MULTISPECIES: dienelactone hydrolase family protein [unclassified Polaromonas]|uniref:dienelactone hydrolase family protein n=1 Tax=unclassified Polaromonas TaxID=2638319 RepID=UPI000F08177F|nr:MULTISPECIES: dipeptidyl aminopeptidase [unclassified Polaromonas]AYQ29134.1 dipeptidyl aminopeptidase [Polaromonas sp. SP1]QGJ19749.1 dipeptidyl aminopeptidase [Polaromonas sp. Pch-P]
MQWWKLVLLVGLPAHVLCGTAWAQQAERVSPQVIKLPLVIDGKSFDVVTHVYKPAGDGPFPLVIFSHGRAPSRVDRAKLENPVLIGHANYWLRKGVAVIAPVRPGYGDTGGFDREDSGIRWSGKVCTGDADFTRVASHAGQTVVALHQWALQQPWVRKDRLLLEGQSVGGMTTVSVAALNLPGVIGAVNFAGGSGGNPEDSPTRSCKPENMAKTYGELGKLVKVPNLWLYAENDQYWGPEAPREWHEAFKAGGSDTQFIQTGPLPGHDGHALLTYGGKMWSVPLDAFVRKVGLTAP